MPIPMEQRLTAVIVSLLLVLVTVQLIRKNKLREEYALAWLAISIGISLLSIFSGVVAGLASFFSVSYAPTLIFVFGLLFVLTILLSQSVALSSQADCIRDLTQNITLLEWRLQQLEKEHNQTNGTHLESVGENFAPEIKPLSSLAAQKSAEETQS